MFMGLQLLIVEIRLIYKISILYDGAFFLYLSNF